MHRLFDNRLNRERLILAPGEYWACNDDVILYTVLGSCVSVCLKDPYANIAGMNHFMLPLPTNRDSSEASAFTSDIGRFGIHAMELVINKMLSLGALKNRLVAKVFGGGHVLPTGKTADRVPTSNINFALNYLETESIPIIATDVGGTQGRKVMFFCSSGSVYVQKLKQASAVTIIKSESKYQDKLQSSSAKESPITFFDED